MVSVTFDVVSVWLVIEPCVKFGTTGTPQAGASVALAPATNITYQKIVFPKGMLTGIILNQLQ